MSDSPPSAEDSAPATALPDQASVRDHGGNLAAAIARFGGQRGDWIDLSTGINPSPYPLPPLLAEDWTALPDADAQQALIAAARRFWQVPDEADILAAPGASALIARLPALRPARTVSISTPTYNEHAAAFDQSGWQILDTGPAEAQVVVHPNNPDGRLWMPEEVNAPFCIIDESFCDICPDQSLIARATTPGTVILKSFGKFWGLAGLRLGFAIGDPELIAGLRAAMGPWAVSGPALRIATHALNDPDWATTTRLELADAAARLDQLMQQAGAQTVGGTDLFRLYDVGDAQAWQDRLARARIWSRIFPYSTRFLRLGLPPMSRWSQLETALT
ncbi:pyridoxal phosphate-dependent class II aminotransferase [Epibacterium sp. MM17-32]|uniref:threonine-phosphate decarboxylase n=1 Tax=Epibacterium sp. MM17-32 TaxID=2917734 RepID=UPI001EF46F80|nr:threonine-phosphate decarboxylase [Epibacterium sp. MM17-32]MCG7628807.1 pyridoxal phosphate-dependent class II aminotransferase [Epibacterium sp. MM17-32]